MFSKYLPGEICAEIQAFPTVQEIRIRNGFPVCVVDTNGIHRMRYRTDYSVVQSVFSALCAQSVYAMKEEIRNGFISLPGGHRAGICGRCVTENGKILNIKDISSINLRVARAVNNCAMPIFQKLRGVPANVILISPPNGGKTTYLRDLCRLFSLQNQMVSVVDERGEIAPMQNGKSVFDLGGCVDVLQYSPKTEGMMLMLRTMNPNLIATDEIGSRSEGQAIAEITKCGVHVLATFHGYSVDDLKKRFSGWKLFQYAVLLNKEKQTEAFVCLNG